MGPTGGVEDVLEVGEENLLLVRWVKVNVASQGLPVPLLCSLIVSSPSGYNTEGGKAAVP